MCHKSYVKVKVKLCVIEAYRGSRCTPPLILYLSTRGRCVVNFMPQLLYAGKNPGTHWIGSGSAPELVWTVMGKKKVLSVLGFEPWTIQSLASHYTYMLSQISSKPLHVVLAAYLNFLRPAPLLDQLLITYSFWWVAVVAYGRMVYISVCRKVLCVWYCWSGWFYCTLLIAAYTSSNKNWI